MKWSVFLSALVLLLLLSGCGRSETVPSAQMPGQAELLPAVPEQELAGEQEGRRDLTFFVEGEREILPATRHTGAGYVIYIPDEGWRFEREIDDGVTEERWESIYNGDVELTVYTYPAYPGASAEMTKLAFLRDSGHVLEDGMGGAPGDPLVGKETDGDYLCFVAAEGYEGVTYIVAWEYPAEAAEGFGARLRVIADTFAVTRE